MDKVIKIINEWNPVEIYPLLEDEYYTQSLKIFEVAKKSYSVEDLTKEIFDVFKQSFGKEFNRSIDECEMIAKEIMKNQR
jgi:hypothetical protein